MKQKTAFLFSGQGSQSVGMGLSLTEQFPGAQRIYACAADIFHFDFKTVIAEGTPEQLGETKIAQPAICITSLVAAHAAKQSGLSPAAVAGHSLGEYAAMVESGMLSLEDCFRAIKIRSEAMQQTAEENPGGMAAVLGGSPETIAAVCDEISASGNLVLPVNYNSPVQTVIAGNEAGLALAETKLREAGIRKIVRLAVSAAFHSPYMQKAADAVEQAFKAFSFQPPCVPFYSNVTGSVLTDFSDMPKLLAQHMVSPVRFTEELQSMQTDGFDVFVEAGPGKVVSGLVKKTLKNAIVCNIEDKESLDAAIRMHEAAQTENA